MTACENSENMVSDHFVDVNKIVEAAKNAGVETNLDYAMVWMRKLSTIIKD